MNGSAGTPTAICHEQREGVPTNYIGTLLTIGFAASTGAEVALHDNPRSALRRLVKRATEGLGDRFIEFRGTSAHSDPTSR